MQNINIERKKHTDSVYSELDELLHLIRKTILAHVIVTESEAIAMTLWCIGTYTLEAFDIFPRLAITSPEKRCGKTTGLKLIEAFSLNSQFSDNMTPASIFRLVGSDIPYTLILDEADTYVVNGSEELRGVINSGHSSRGSVMRCIGTDHVPTKFQTYSAMALGCIGGLPDTIMDRSIHINIKRKVNHESVQRLPRRVFDECEQIREWITNWAIENIGVLEISLVEPPEITNDRGMDNWLPLFTIAKLASPEWLQLCKTAYFIIESVEVEPSLSNQLLNDIRDIFINQELKKIRTSDLIKALTQMEEKPWSEYKVKGISPHGLSNLLKPYGIRPKNIKFGVSTPKGYTYEQFEDTFIRFLDPL